MWTLKSGPGRIWVSSDRSYFPPLATGLSIQRKLMNTLLLDTIIFSEKKSRHEGRDGSCEVFVQLLLLLCAVYSDDNVLVEFLPWSHHLCIHRAVFCCYTSAYLWQPLCLHSERPYLYYFPRSFLTLKFVWTCCLVYIFITNPSVGLGLFLNVSYTVINLLDYCQMRENVTNVKKIKCNFITTRKAHIKYTYKTAKISFLSCHIGNGNISLRSCYILSTNLLPVLKLTTQIC